MLKPSLLRFLVQVYRHYQLAGPMLSLGVQDVLVGYDEAQQLLRESGITPQPIPESQRETTTAFLKHDRTGRSPLIHARTFFRMLGVADYHDLDASTAEEPGLIHDLNQPVPATWHGQFNWLLDAGTLEHVFDTRAALGNLVRMTRTGGHVLHISPTTGWANHGFYQLSPCLFYDFYESNGFQAIVGFLVAQRSGPGRGIEVSEYHYMPKRLIPPEGSESALFAFLARKVEDLPEIVVPSQRKYASRMTRSMKQAG